jgi:hypothetical protein
VSSNEARRRVVPGYLQRDMAVISVPTREKNPGYDGWQNLWVAPEDVPRCWPNGQNVGALNGEPSGWRVCANVDVLEALGIAGSFFLNVNERSEEPPVLPLGVRRPKRADRLLQGPGRHYAA